jgi:adenylate cyclase
MAQQAVEAQPVQRKLAAILAADVAGYSRLMGADEEGTLARLKTHRHELIVPKIQEHHGHVVKLTGDGILIEFPSVVEAVRCAIEMQQGMAERNADVPKELRIEFRVGINLGDVIVEADGDIYGDGVNIAARLEGLAQPGATIISGAAYDQIRNKFPFACTFLGERRVKNIAEPVRVYQVCPQTAAVRRPGTTAQRLRQSWLAGGTALVLLASLSGWYLVQRPVPTVTSAASRLSTTSERGSGPALSEQPSLAVLPFANLSGDPALDYFSDGLTEDLTTQLSQNPELLVVARTSALAYKGKSTDIRQVGRELGARYVLEGSIRRANDRVRITAQLIDTSTGHHVWAKRYDEESEDIFALQDEVIQKIATTVGGIQGQIRAASYPAVWRKDTTSLQEYDYFLRIHGLLLRGPEADVARARAVAIEGLQRFPDSGLMRIKLGWTYMQDVDRGYSNDPRRDLRRAFDLADEGLTGRDLPHLAQMHGHWLMSLAFLYQRDFERALNEREAALATAPGDPILLVDLSRVLVFAGRAETTITALEKAMQHPSQASPFVRFGLGVAYCAAAQYANAIEALSRLPGPSFYGSFRALLFQAASLAALERIEEARGVAAELLRKHPGTTVMALREVLPFRDRADQERILESLRKAGVPEA